MKFFKDLFTEANNETFCLVKVIAGLGVLVFLGCAISHVLINHAFNSSDFGLGLGSIMAGSGGALALKKDTPL